jgi:TolB-like protein/Flp pilus assembly protein TadD
VSLLQELKRRNVFRVGIAYLVGAWVLAQVAELLLSNFEAPAVVMKSILVVLIIGFPVAMFLAWVYELTPEGIKPEAKVDRRQSITSQTGRKLDRVIIAFLVVALGYFAYDKFAAPVGGSRAERAPTGGESTNPDVGALFAADSRAKRAPTDGESANQKSIVVLPFVNMSSDPEQEYFSDGLAEELLNRLAKNPNLRVAARTSAFQFKGQNLDVADIGRQLKVDHVLEGSVRKSGNRLRITAQLIKAQDGFHVWSETYERELTDVFAIQDGISAAIANALELELGNDSGEDVAKLTSNIEAYNLYLQARFYLASRIERNMLQAADLFQQAAALDPGFSKAWSGLALTYALLPWYGTTIAEAEGASKALESAEAAIKLDPENAEAWVARGYTEAQFLWDWAAAETSLERAITLAPNDADVVNLYGSIMLILGDFERTERYERLAVELDPLAAVQHGDLAIAMLILNRNEEGLEYARTSARLGPDSVIRISELFLALQRVGKFDEARQYLELVDQNLHADPGFLAAWWCQYYYEQKDIPQLREALAHYIELGNSGTGFVMRTTIAFYTAWLDGVDAALPWLEKAYQRRESYLTIPDTFYLPERISTDPKWLEFWNQPGLRELMDIRRGHEPLPERVGYWKERP